MRNLINSKKKFLLILIVLLGLFLRFYMLGSNPPSLNWDEASTGYNAYSILKTGKDEYGNFLPLSIRSFDDYKPPLYTYLVIPFIATMDLTDKAVRLPSAILGTLSILIIYCLVLELFPKRENTHDFVSYFNQEIALISAFFFAISPWSLQFSRAAYEGNVGLFFLMCGVLLFLRGLRKEWLMYLSSASFVLAMYSYHSFRLIVPVLFIVIAILFYKNLWKIKKTVILSCIILVVLVAPIFASFVSSTSGTGSRLSMVTIFGPSPNLDESIKELEYDKAHGDALGEVLHNRRIVYVLAVAKGYLDHYDPDFLFLHGDGGRQHHAVNMGMMYLFDLPLLLIGFVVLCLGITRRKLFLFALLLIAPLPSAITTGTPHPVRAIAMLPELIIIAGVGAAFLLDFISSIKYQVFSLKIKYILFTILFFLFSINLVYYFHQYYVHTPIEYGDFWQYGYKEVMQYAKENENKYDRIVITYKYDQPYVYYLYYNKIDPSWYQKNWNFTGTGIMPRFERKIGKYDFKNINFGDEQKSKNTLIIGTPDEVPVERAIKEIKFLNGDTAFRIAHT